MNNLKELLLSECNGRFSMDSEIMTRFMDMLEERHLKKEEVLTEYGEMDTNVYVIKSGIIRLVYFEGLNEKTLAFGTPGSLFTQMHCYYLNQPSFFRCTACTEAAVMYTSRKNFNSLVEESKEFSQWVLDRALDQLCGLEVRLERLNGQAYERYASMVKNCPQVVNNVSDRLIASYLGITPAWLSVLKKKHSLNIIKNNYDDLKPVSSKSI